MLLDTGSCGEVPELAEDPMPHIDIDVLAPFAAEFTEGTTLTPAERSEVLRIAQGFACKDSAAAADVSPETIRARRKRIYRKLGVSGSGELIAVLLSRALGMLAVRRQPETRAPAAGVSRLTIAQPD
jgi:DNA-binding CsgD family transcriptional regulator